MRTLANDIVSIKSDSIIVNNDVYSNIKKEGIEEVSNNFNKKFDLLEKHMGNIVRKLGKLENTDEMTSKATEKEETAPQTAQKEEPRLEPAKVNKRKSSSSKHQVTWVGTSISKVLNKKKLENDLDVELTSVKAYCVQEEGRFPESNFKAVVPKVLENGNVGTLILETGSIEITNIDVNNAMMDPKKDIKEYKEEWFAKAEEVSTELFNIAETAINANKNLNIIILKRLPRFDRSSNDLLKIKSDLSSFANHTYDQLWLKRGSPKRIHVTEVKLCKQDGYLKDLIYGKQDSSRFDGVHLTGSGASRQFTYLAIQAVKPLISKPNPEKKSSSFWRQHKASNRRDDHQNNQQSNKQRSTGQSATTGHGKRSDKKYSDVLKESSQQNMNSFYTVPTANFFNPLNC